MVQTGSFPKKAIALIMIIAFFFYCDAFLLAQSKSEINDQFLRAKKQYLNGQYKESKNRLERIIGIAGEKDLQVNEILGACHLLLGAIYEKEEEPVIAGEHYNKAKTTYNIKTVEGVPLEKLPTYNAIINQSPTNQTITKEGKKKKKKFPWLLVAGGVVIVTAAVLLLTKKKKKRTLTVTMGDGIEGSPNSGSYSYKDGETVSYNYQLKEGYTDLLVMVDGQRVAASGTVKMSANHSITASANANEVAFIVDKETMEIDEGETTTFQIRLSAQPAGNLDVTVQHTGGDSDISVLSGDSVTFTPSNWDTYRTVVLSAVEDTDTQSGQATFDISAPGINTKTITVTERDNDVLNFVTDSEDVSVTEGGLAVFRVKLTSQPADNIVTTVNVVSGDTDIRISSGETLTFTPGNWDTFQSVTIRASEDDDTVNGETVIRLNAPNLPYKEILAREVDNDTLNLVTDTSTVTITEGSTNSFKVKLSSQPTGTVVVSVVHFGGDTDISITAGSSLTFNSSNWNTYQTVQLQAAEDTDTENGIAIIRLSASDIESQDIIISESDND